LPITPLAERLTSQTDAAARDQDQEHPRSHGVGGQVLLSDAVLALPAGAVDDQDLVGVAQEEALEALRKLSERPDSAGAAHRRVNIGVSDVPAQAT